MDELTKHYQALFQKYGDDSRSLQHSDQESQVNRFKELLKEISLDKKATFLDFGCGLGHLATYLENQNLIQHYYGIDVVPDFVDHANEKFSSYDHISFHQLNISTDPLPIEAVDYVLISGTYNNNMKDNEDFLFRSLEKLFKITRKTLALNLLSTYVDYQDEELFYIDPEKVFTFAKKLTPLVTLRHDYTLKSNSFPYEYTIHLHKRETE